MAALVESMIGGFAGEDTGSVDSLLEVLGCSKYVVDEITYASRTAATGTFIKNSLKQTPRLVVIIAKNFNNSSKSQYDLHSLCINNPSLRASLNGSMEFINLTGNMESLSVGATFSSASGSGYLFPATDGNTYYFQAGVTYKMISAV